MGIRRTKAGTYILEIYYSKEVQLIIGTSKRYKKTFKTYQEAVKAEKKEKNKIDKVKKENNARALEVKGNEKFSKFYQEVWLDMYIAGSTGHTKKAPSQITVKNTKDIFRLHILPVFGKYSLNWLNDNKDFVLRQLTVLSRDYANIKVVKGYFNQVFELAELLDYIEYNRIAKVVQYVSAPKKQMLKEKRQVQGRSSMTAEQLISWLDVIKKEYQQGIISMQDYVLFLLTLNLGNRKSESYALQWKHVLFEDKQILLVQNLSKTKELKSTKGQKKTKIILSEFLIQLLKKWKLQQANELKKIGIKQDSEQFLFTYSDRLGNINVPLHIDYLNYRLNSIYRRNPFLVKASPHKLRHTFSTLAREGGASMAEISEALTHSDLKTTEVYVNTPNVVSLSAHEKFEERIKQARMKSRKNRS